MSWGDDLDLLGPRIRPGPLAWLLLLGGALAVVAMAQRQSELQDDQARAQARLEHVERVQRALKNRSRADAAQQQASAVEGVPVADAKTLTAAARVVEHLGHPWSDVLTGVEEAGQGVALLHLEHDSDSGLVQIEAAVRDDEAAWRFVEALSADAGRFAEAELVERQVMNPPVPDFNLRVRVQARLAELSGPRPAGQGAAGASAPAQVPRLFEPVTPTPAASQAAATARAQLPPARASAAHVPALRGPAAASKEAR